MGSRKPLSPAAVVGSGCVLGALLLTVMHWTGWLVVVSGRAVPLWPAAAVLLLAAFVLSVWSAASRRSRPGRSQRGLLPRWLSISIAVIASAGVGLAGAADLVNGATYTVLEPSAPSGCHAAVRETAFPFAGTGEVYEIGALGVGHRVGSWGVDDGYRPIANGHYKLQWGRSGCVLHVWGDAHDPMVGRATPGTCRSGLGRSNRAVCWFG